MKISLMPCDQWVNNPNPPNLVRDFSLADLELPPDEDFDDEIHAMDHRVNW